MKLDKAIEANPAVLGILSSSCPNTVAAERITGLGVSVSEATVRRWRRAQLPAVQDTWAPSQSLSDTGLQLWDALQPRELPSDPVALLDGLLADYSGPGQPDLKVVRRTDADGVETLTVTATTDRVAVAAAQIMADRVLRGEEHRCLVLEDGQATVVTRPRNAPPLFPPGTPLRRLQRYAEALTRLLRPHGWVLTAQPGYALVYARLDVREPSREIRLLLAGL